MCRYLPSELSRNEKNLAFRKNVLKKARSQNTDLHVAFVPSQTRGKKQYRFDPEAKIKVFQGEAANRGLNNLFFFICPDFVF